MPLDCQNKSNQIPVVKKVPSLIKSLIRPIAFTSFTMSIGIDIPL